ncbi:ABC transporter ATP-binding protein [Microvirga lotononidis]|uniref:Spermidine/putrescine import ATP-binding protein PotA n=1 Tax=Microvirga lotononidis TaxID=864069 RepID=I4YWJ9_9HYPH|nr:ABC transporter ATP-binding protein [Microvirga lotononidis]EIM28341.1 spermidine/putrescine ABC transporter ATP-binding subunit [Microvirga lotononidis]WQO29923.1 ABC transporter ATP-binding protein [Microvirga lotononidis]
MRRAFAPWSNPDAKPLIRFDNVTKRFGDAVAVDHLSLNIFEGEFFCLLGPSGCGKTTLMRMLAGFETPSEGTITLGHQSLAGVPPYRRPVNMMFQSYALFPHMSVEKNIAFGLKQDGMPKNQIAERVGEMLRLVQLEKLARRYPSQLSGGQRQRVALARALAKKPKVLLLDEPLGALDKKLREETQFELMDIQHELGMTFVVVTHDQEEAMTMADRIAVMDHGRIAQVATPGEIYEQPKTRFIAEFVGDVNILEGHVQGQENGLWRVQTASAQVPLTIDDPDEVLHSGQAVAIAVRPEKMVIQRDPPRSDALNVLTGEVWDIGYLGDWTVYRVKLATGEILRVSRANASRFVENPIDWDEQVYVTFAPDAAVILAE